VEYTASFTRYKLPSFSARPWHRRPGLVLAMTGLALADRTAPALGAWAAARMCMRLPRGTSANEFAAPADGYRDLVRVAGLRSSGIMTEAWGEGPVVYLMHGWGSNRESWYAFVGPLTRAGFRVVALDALGHGDSGPGAYGRGRTVFPELVTALRAAVGHHGPAHAVVAHSMGALATQVAILDGLPAERLVLISPPPDMWSAIQPFADTVGFGKHIQARMPRAFERLLRTPLSQFDAAARAAECETLPPALVIHDVTDKRVPFRLGAMLATAWPCARLQLTRGLGHNRLLHDEEVIAASAEFVAAR
jgi:pimeloyl-ACP methyl ester carboxylesterase